MTLASFIGFTATVLNNVFKILLNPPHQLFSNKFRQASDCLNSGQFDIAEQLFPTFLFNKRWNHKRLECHDSFLFFALY